MTTSFTVRLGDYVGTLHLAVNVLALFWKTPRLLKLKKTISFSRGRTLSGHTCSTTKKFSILKLSSLHSCGKPCLGYVAQLRFVLLDYSTRCSATANNCSATLQCGRTMSFDCSVSSAPARTSSRRRCTTGTRRSGTSCGGYDPGYPWQTTWPVLLGVVQPTR